MKRNPILYVLLAILIAQPLLIIGFGPSTTATVLQPDDGSVLSQGTRLDPDDHTDHVPIFINGTGDFVAQGWPGSGTSGDPYVIAGLNITYGIGLACIAIFNTDAYFVIRDCYIGQNSALNGIHLEDTSHATLEYVTVSSPSHAIHAMNANNTQFRHLDVTASGALHYALDLWYSNLCTLESSVMVSVDYRCVVSSYCDTFTMTDNTLTAVYHKYAVNAYYSPTFTSTNDVILEGFSMRVDYSNHSVVTGLTSNVQWGVQFPYSFFCSLVDSDIVAYTYDGVYIYYGGSLTATGNTIEAARYGLYVETSNDTTFEDNTVTSCGIAGVYLTNAHHTDIILNDISSSGDDGMYILNSEDVRIEDNTITDTVDAGIVITTSHNGFLIDNILSEIGNTGIDLQTCNNWSVSENFITGCGENGIEILGGAFTDVWYNEIEDVDFSWYGLYVDTHGMFEAWENTVREGYCAYYFTGSDWLYVRDNVAYGSEVGIVIYSSENHSIDNNHFYDSLDYGIYLYGVDTSSFSGNQIFTGPEHGIYVTESEYLNFSSNLLTDCGFFFVEDNSPENYNHTFTGNEVNAIPVLYVIDEAGMSYNGDSYGQIILVACNDTTITGGTFDKTTSAVLLYNCLRTTLDGVTSLNNKYGFFVEQSENTTITSCISENNIDGLWIRESDFSDILDSDFIGGSNGIRSGGDYQDSISISDCNFNDITSVGIKSPFHGDNWTISDCTFSNVHQAIRIGGFSDFVNISYNYFEYSWRTIEVGNIAENGLIFGNEIYYTTELAIFISNADWWEIKNNTILWTGQTGIHLQLGSNINPGAICYNTVGLSGTSNGYDSLSENWDDNVGTGNWWSDYDGVSPTYSVGSGTDRYPMMFAPTEPIMNELMDMSYAEGTTGNTLDWMPYDDFLKEYMVTIDGAFWEQDAVSDIELPTITVNIDGLSYGVHTLVITVYDIDLNSVSDTVTINVFDDIDPIIDNPPNFEIFFGVNGNEIIWEAEDLHPDNYVAMMDDSEYATGPWTSDEVALSIDGLSVGAHHFTMIVYDADGNSASDSVSILVINDVTGPTIDSPDDIVFVVESTGNRIIWTPTDEYPDSFEIEFNETIMVSGDWSGGRIIFELDNLEVGDYNFTITVLDGGQQSASDMVVVQVIPYTGWTPALPPFDFTLLIIAGVGITVVVIGVIYFLKFKKPSSGGA